MEHEQIPDRFDVAVHEAAHAVANHRAVIDTGTVTIIPSPQEGSLSAVQSGDWWNDEELEGEVVSLLAGVAAEIELLGRTWGEASPGAGNDIEKAECLIERFFLGVTVDEWLTKAQEFVRREEDAIRYAAEILVAFEVLDDFDWVMDDFENRVPVEEAIEGIRKYRKDFGIEVVGGVLRTFRN